MAGRPTLFRDEYIEQARKLAQRGLTDVEVADFFDVTVRTIYRWKGESDEFCHALRAGKEIADERIENSIFMRAAGFEHDAVKIFMPAGATEPVYAEYKEYVPPDTNAAIFWLKNRKGDVWRDKVQSELSGPGGGPIPLSLEIDTAYIPQPNENK